MTDREREQYIKLGQELVRMIRDVRSTAKADLGYARRTFSFPGGSVEVIVANDQELAKLFDYVADHRYEIQERVPPSATN